MKDFIRAYHKKKVLTHLGILSLSVIMAVSINTFFLTGSTGKMLKANVLEATGQSDSQEVDFLAQASTENISFSNSKLMQSVQSLSFSLAYNSDLFEAGDISSTLLGVHITPIQNDAGYINYTLTFDTPQDILPNTELLSLIYSRQSSETIHLNIINVNFEDSSHNAYSLSSSGIIF